jgi:hypothetical protein
MPRRRGAARVAAVAAALVLQAAPPAPAAPAAADDRLDVDVVVFDDGVPESAAVRREMGVFPSVRRVESRYLAIGLRDALVEGGRFGVVRAVPKADEGAELTLDGTIVRSDGRMLTLAVTAADATGRPWIETSYTLDLAAAARRADSMAADDADVRALPTPDPSDPDAGGGGTVDTAGDAGVPGTVPASSDADAAPTTISGLGLGLDDAVLAPLYRRILADLQRQLDALDDRDLQRIRDVAAMRYAAELSPEQFSAYLSRQEDGRLTVTRLPAKGDPMLERIRRIRRRDLQLKDTVDELYRQSYEDVEAAYRLWREYITRQTRYVEDREARLAGDDGVRRRSTSYAGLRQSYENYKWSKVQEQTLRRLAGRFDSEVSPTVQEVEGTVVELTGNIDAQYEQWKEILRSIFELETGEAPPAP